MFGNILPGDAEQSWAWPWRCSLTMYARSNKDHTKDVQKHLSKPKVISKSREFIISPLSQAHGRFMRLCPNSYHASSQVTD